MTVGYVANRLGMLFLVIVIAVTVNFIIPRLMPGDPVEQKLNQLVATGGSVGDVQGMVAEYKQKFGLDQPMWKQYVNYWNDLLHLDLGYSLANFPQRVSDIILSSLPYTAGLLVTTLAITFTVGVFMGAFVAWPGAPSGLRAIVPFFMILHAIPYFLLGIVLLFIFAVYWRLMPAGGAFAFGTALGFNWRSIADLLMHAALPAASLFLAGVGAWALGMRGMMVSILGEDYILLAEAKGLKSRRIFTWYGVRNALLPQTTAFAMSLGHVVSGAVLVELIFAYPGVGQQLYRAIHAKDYFVIQGIVLVLIVSIAVSLFIVDIAYPLIDPRVSFRRR